MSRYNITQKSALLRAALVAVLLAALPSVHASLHEASVELQDFLHKIQPSAPQTSSRKLLGGADCLQYVSASANIYVGTCSGLETKSEDHWCDMSTVLNSCDASNNYCGAGYTLYSGAVLAANAYGLTSGAACFGDSGDDCCESNAGAVAGWSLQSGDSLTLSSNTCSAGYTTCQATCAQGYSVFKSGSAYTLTSTATSSSLPSDCSCYTLGPATPTSSTWSGSIPVGPGTSVQGSVTETSATTYTVVLQTSPGPCTLTYTKKNTGASLGSGSGVSRLTQTFTFTALVVSALALVV